MDINPAEVEYYKAVGMALTRWSALEQLVANLFCLAIGADNLEAALQAHWSVHSFEQRLRMTSEAVKLMRNRNDAILGEWKALASDIRKANEKRNELAHGTVVGYIKAPDAPVLKFVPYMWADTQNFGEGISLGDVQGRSGTFSALMTTLAEFNGKAAQLIIGQADKA